MNTITPYLSLLVWVPIFTGFSLLLVAKIKFLQNKLRFIPLLVVFYTLCVIAVMLLKFTAANPQMQFLESKQWIESLGIYYALGVDGLALLLIALTVFMNLVVMLAALTHVERNIFIPYCANFLIMQGLMCGVFAATDAILFYVFFEAMMIPMFLIIGIWGAENRIYATMKFILYTLFGSLFLLVSILYLNHLTVADATVNGVGSFAMADLQNLNVAFTAQKWLFWAMLLAFAIKVPMWPVHTWLPDAHVEAPTGGSIILAAITLKIGGYGMLRFILPMVPAASIYYASIVMILSLIAIIYIGLVTIVQQDLKKLIAYSSIAHMGFVTLGIFTACKVIGMSSGQATAILGIDGAVVQMLAHGFVSGALFLCVGILYVRMHTRQIAEYGGVVNSMPIFASFFMLFALANVGMPGTVGFVGEFFVILASYKAGIYYALIASCALVLSVAYTLWLYKRVIFGEVISNSVAALRDLNFNEKVICILLAFAILFFGIWPNPILNMMRHSSNTIAFQLKR